MPMIDVTAPAGLLPAASLDPLRSALTAALLDAERAPRTSPFVENTGFFLHELPSSHVGTAEAGGTPVVRVLVTTPPGALDRAGQRSLVSEATRLVAEAVGQGPAPTTWVLLTEAAEGGWGVSGVALGQEEFAALRRAS